MTSEQTDAAEALIATCDRFVHATGQDHPEVAAEAAAFAERIGQWMAGGER